MVVIAGVDEVNGTGQATIDDVQPPPIDFLWWRLDETSGTTATDSGPNGYHVTNLISPVWDSGLVCNGVSAGGSVPVPADYRDPPLTISAWVTAQNRSDKSLNSYSLTPFPPNIVSNDIPFNGGYGIGLNVWTDDGGGSEYVNHTGGSGTFLKIASLLSAVRYHLAVVYSAGATVLYVNGAPVASGPPADPTNGATSLYLGRHNDDTGYGTKRFFKGTIRDVRIWQQPLSAGEIATLNADGPWVAA